MRPIALTALFFAACTSNTDTDTDTHTDTAPPCDFADIQGVWQGTIAGNAFQRLTVGASAEIGQNIGSNLITLTADGPVGCEFELVCESNLPRVVSNPVVQNNAECMDVDYELELGEDGSLVIRFPNGEGPSYTLQRPESGQ